MKAKNKSEIMIFDTVKISGDHGLWIVVSRPDDTGGVDVALLPNMDVKINRHPINLIKQTPDSPH